MFFWRTLQEFSMHIRACVLSSCSALQMQRCKLLNALSGGREPWKERSSPNPRRDDENLWIASRLIRFDGT
ncbi:hypothetical protein LEMLEM_LOCUS7463 [Lemmus lemmus]